MLPKDMFGVDVGRTLRALSWVFGFLLPIRLFSDLIASRGWTVFERMVSEISRLRAISSLSRSVRSLEAGGRVTSYRLLLVAFSICSSKAVLAEEDHQLIILPSGVAKVLGGRSLRSGLVWLGGTAGKLGIGACVAAFVRREFFERARVICGKHGLLAARGMWWICDVGGIELPGGWSERWQPWWSQ